MRKRREDSEKRREKIPRREEREDSKKRRETRRTRTTWSRNTAVIKCGFPSTERRGGEYMFSSRKEKKIDLQDTKRVNWELPNRLVEISVLPSRD
jgi:hypothetical protein